MDKGEDSIVFLNSVKGIEYVRPPTLKFLKIKDTHDFIEYKIDNDTILRFVKSKIPKDRFDKIEKKKIIQYKQSK